MESIWSRTCQIKRREPLAKDMKTEIAVIGAGLAGILTAYKLQKTGKQVILLEANRIASGQTRNTTAKITSQHGLIYCQLLKLFGEEKTKQYAMANETAIQEYKRIITEEHIECDFEETSAYVYSNHMELLKKEAEAAKQAGIHASLVTDLSLPFKTAGAVRFENQAQFHPLKFIKAIAEKLTIYENTSVQAVEDHLILTNRGKVEAQKIVFACHYPFINFPGMYFARMHQERSYVLALKNASFPKGMFIGADQHPYSLRSYGDLLLLGGESHRTGENAKGGRYDALRRKAKEWFPDSEEAAHWSAQDCVPPDHVPYIGQYAAGKPDWYVATGFQKWGMTSSMTSAALLCDLICEKENPYADLFTPERFSAKEIPQVAGESGQAVKGLAKRFFQIPKDTAKDIPVGFGGIVTLNGDKAGVYKDESGRIHAVDVRCPHLGCQLEWNPDERSWDCPCHGSRFDYFGRLISGPAQEDICNA